jgi:hypothetical protein
MYPDSALSAWQLAIMAVVAAASLAAWLIAVFLAARQPRGMSAVVNAGPREEETAATVTKLPPDARPSDKAAALSGKAPPEWTSMAAQRTGMRMARSRRRHQ